MEQPAKNSLSVLGVGLALCSLWFTWMSFHQVPIESEAANVFQSLMGAEPMTYTGLVSGFDAELLYIPIWFVAVLISMAHVSQLMGASSFFFIPRFTTWGLTAIAVFFPVFAIVYPIFHPGVTPSYGPYIALVSTAIALVNLIVDPSATRPRDKNVSQSTSVPT